MTTDLLLLGPLEVRAAGLPVEIAAGKQRAVLAALLLEVGRPVELAGLIARLWPERPPPTARAAVRNHISAVRRSLAGVPDAFLDTVSRGYVLHADPSSLDSHRFAALADRGRAALRDGDGRAAELALDEALGTWRGPALADLVDQEGAWPEAAELDERRITAVEHRVEADLLLGRHRRLVPQLERWTREHPGRETLRHQHMLALYRCGRQAHALAVYGDVRDRLRAQGGRTPGVALQRLHQAIIEQRADTDTAAPGGEGGSVLVIPRERPAGPAGGIDELREVAALALRIEHHDPDPGRASVPVTLLRAVRDEVAAHGGWVAQVLGRTVLALFKVPDDAGDDAHRALAAALGVQQIVRRSVGGDVSAAVASGTVLVRHAPGAGDGPAVVGQVIDVCTDLLHLTRPGRVHVCDRTRRATGLRFCYRTARDGLRAPRGSVWEVVSAAPVPSAAPAPPTAHVGRDAELALLTSLVEQSRDRPHLCTVSGPAGIGKTRLVREVQRRSTGAHWCWVEVPGPGRPGQAPVEGTARAALVRPLRELLTRPGSPGSAARWREALRATAHPVVLVVDDAHRADDELLDLVERIGEISGPAPLLVLAASRPELFTRRPGWGGGQRDALAITVPPLGTADLRRLVRDAAPAVLSSRRLDEICVLAAGNPRFAVEYAAEATGPAPAAPRTPPAVRGVIDAVIDALSRQEAEVLRAATVLEPGFDVRALVTATGGDDGSVAASLAELVRRELLRPAAEGFAVTAPQVRSVVAGRTPLAVRTEIRSRVARAGTPDRLADVEPRKA